MFPHKIDDPCHASGSWLRIRGQTFNSDLSQSVGITEITVGFMCDNDFPVRKCRDCVVKIFIEFVEFYGIFLIICFIKVFVFRISGDECIFDVFHFFFGIFRIQPDMGIKSTIVRVGMS